MGHSRVRGESHHTPTPGTPSSLTLRSNNPWEMFSETMNPDTRWWMGPASPQCGRRTKVWKPLFLQWVFV